jgi:hypothetical protein
MTTVHHRNNLQAHSKVVRALFSINPAAIALAPPTPSEVLWRLHNRLSVVALVKIRAEVACAAKPTPRVAAICDVLLKCAS